MSEHKFKLLSIVLVGILLFVTSKLQTRNTQYQRLVDAVNATEDNELIWRIFNHVQRSRSQNP